MRGCFFVLRTTFSLAETGIQVNSADNTPWRRAGSTPVETIREFALYRINVFAPRHGDIPKTAFWGEKSSFSGDFRRKTAIFPQKQAENPQK